MRAGTCGQISSSRKILHCSVIDLLISPCSIICSGSALCKSGRIEDDEIIYVDYETHELSIIQFSDLVVGDAVIINAYEKNLNAADDSPLNVEQIQLATQRLEQPDKEE